MFQIVLQNQPNTIGTGQVRAFAHTFGSAAPNGGFGVTPPLPLRPAVADRSTYRSLFTWVRQAHFNPFSCFLCLYPLLYLGAMYN